MDENAKQEGLEAGGFFQKPAFNAFERLICSHLIEASKGEPLQTVIHVARAALAITDDTAKQLGIDQDVVRSLYTVSQRISAAVPDKDKYGDLSYIVNLSTLDWDKCIKTWIQMGAYEHLIPFSIDREEWNSLAKKRPKLFFHTTNRRLTPGGYSHMVSDFLLYAIPIVEEMSRKLATLVSPETYTELLRLYYGEKP